MSLTVAAVMLLSIFPASAVDVDSSAAISEASVSVPSEMDDLQVSAPEEVVDPKYENYTIEKLPSDLESRLALDETALKLDTADAEDPYSITTVNSDGTKTLRVFNEPVKYIDEETDKVEFIDTSLTAASGDNAYQCITNSKKSYFPKDISKGVMLTNGKKSITMIPVTTQVKKNGKIKHKKVKVKGKNHAQYEEVFGEGTSLQYVPTAGGIKENIVLEQYNGVNEFSYIIDAKKLVPKEMSGTTITFIDPETEEEVWRINETFIYDARYNTESHTENCVSYNNYYTLKEQNNGKYLLTTTVDKEFLESSDTVYPVTVDPLYAWASASDSVYCGSFPADENYVDTAGRLFLGNYNGTQWRTWVRFGNFKRFYFINPDRIEEADIILDLYDEPQGTTTIYAGTSTNGNSITQSPDRDECFGNLTRIATSQIATQFNNYINITGAFKGWLEDTLESGGTFVPGCVFYVPATTSTYFEIPEDYLPVLSVCYRDDHKLPEDLYYISNGDYYLYAKETDSGTIQTYWKEHEELPSESYNSGYLWYASVDASNQFYTIKSYKKFSGERNYYLNNSSNNNSTSASDNDVTLKEKESTTRQQWHIVGNSDGTYRIINNYVVDGIVIDALTKSSSNNITCLNYAFKDSQKWTFTACPSNTSVVSGAVKSVSSWPAADAQSSTKNLLRNKTPQRLEYKAKGTVAATGSGTAAAYDGASVSSGATMTDGKINNANVDIRGYTLTQEGEDGYMRYINRSTRKYRNKGTLYLEIVYNLGALKDVDCLWLATNTAASNYQIGAFEVYTAQGTESLFFTRNKRGTFDHTSGQWSGVACVSFSSQVEAKYIGIRVTQGVVKKPNNATWTESELEHAYARIRDIALFNTNYKKVIVENYYDAGMLQRWGATSSQMAGSQGIPYIGDFASEFFEQLEYDGENIGIDITFNTIGKYTSTTDKCTSDINSSVCSCPNENHVKEQNLKIDFQTAKEYIEDSVRTIPALWTGHTVVNDYDEDGEIEEDEIVNDGAMTCYDAGYHLFMLNTGYCPSLGDPDRFEFDEFCESESIQHSYIHELCHTMGATDSYCTGIPPEKEECKNENCVECYSGHGYSAKCIMANMWYDDLYFENPEKSYYWLLYDMDEWLCDKCKEDIYNFLNLR